VNLLWAVLVASPILSPHYELHSEAETARAREYSGVLEAAWPEYRRIFGGEPKLAEGERLKVRHFADRHGWAAAIRADGATPPPAAGGYYWPATKTAFLYDQPTRSYTRTLLLHEAAHQFHYLACTNNRPPGAGWYTEGIAEFAAEHFWDGETLRLGVVQLVTLKDYPRRATGGGRPRGWALVHYLASEEPERFATLRAQLDRGADLEPPEPEGFTAWLARNQEPWAQVFNEWNGVGPRALRGFAEHVSACRLKAPANLLRAELRMPRTGRFRAGLLLEYRDAEDYTLLLVDRRGTLDLHRRRGGKWIPMQRHAGLKLDRERVPFVATRGADGVTVVVAGRKFGPWDLAGPTLGLALDSCDVVFDRLEWR